MKKTVITLALAFALGASSFAKDATTTASSIAPSAPTNYVVKGQIIDFETKEALTGVAIEINNQKIYTDFDGNFEVTNVCDGKCEMSLNMISYRNKTVVVNTKNDVDIMIEMKR